MLFRSIQVTEHHQSVKPEIGGFMDKLMLRLLLPLTVLGGQDGLSGFFTHFFKYFVEALGVQAGYVGIPCVCRLPLLQHPGQLGQYITHDSCYYVGFGLVDFRLVRFRSDGFRIRRGTADPAFLSGPVELLRLDKDLVCGHPRLIFQPLIEAVCSARVTGDAADLLNLIADRVAVAVESDLYQLLHVPRLFTFAP